MGAAFPAQFSPVGWAQGCYEIYLFVFTFSLKQIQKILSLNSLLSLGIGETKNVKALLDAAHGVTEGWPMIEVDFEEIR